MPAQSSKPSIRSGATTDGGAGSSWSPVGTSIGPPPATPLHITTQIGWLPDLSGETEAEAVAAHGAMLCTHCFPAAPVEWTTKAPKPVDPDECPGSRNYVPGANLRLCSPRGTCPQCGRTVSVTSRGNARKH